MNTDQKNEVWAKIPGINYEASDLGRIRHSKKKTIKPSYDNGRGYRSFVTFNGGAKIRYVHRCVLMAFRPLDGMERMDVNHKDFNRSNNHLDNIEWVSRIGNLNYSRRNGNYLAANVAHSLWMKENSSLLKLGYKKKSVVAIQDTAVLEFDSQKECADYFNVSTSIICHNIKNSKPVFGFNLYR